MKQDSSWREAASTAPVHRFNLWTKTAMNPSREHRDA
jgi:hypothetical protein